MAQNQDPRKVLQGEFAQAILGRAPHPSEMPSPEPEPEATETDTPKDPIDQIFSEPKEKPSDRQDGEGDGGDGKEKPVTPPAPAIEPEAIASAVAEGVARATARQQESGKETKKEEEYPEQYREYASVFDMLARQNPERYGNIKQKLNAAVAAENQYVADWKRANPGKPFDPNAEDHAEFFESIDVKVSKRDRQKAETEVLRQSILKDVESKQEKQARQIERQQTIATVERKAGAAVEDVFRDFITTVAPDADLKSEESIREAIQGNPAADEILRARLPGYIETVRVALAIDSGAVEYDPKNKIHQGVQAHLVELNEKLLNANPEQSRRNGRQYCSIDRYDTLTEAQKARVWTITSDDVVRYVANKAKSELKSAYGRITGKSQGATVQHQPRGRLAAMVGDSTRSTQSSSGGAGGGFDRVDPRPSGQRPTRGNFLNSVLGR
jgi:hypothetical protein